MASSPWIKRSVRLNSNVSTLSVIGVIGFILGIGVCRTLTVENGSSQVREVIASQPVEVPEQIPAKNTSELFEDTVCISIAYNKPPKTGSTTVRQVLYKKFPKAKYVKDEYKMGKIESPEASNFDVHDCHGVWSAWFMARMSAQARFPLFKMTTLRDPVDRFVSRFWYGRPKDSCKGGPVSLDQVRTFAQSVYKSVTDHYYSRPYTYNDIVAGGTAIAREECTFWDLFWHVDALAEVTDTVGIERSAFNTRSVNNCPRKKQFLEDEEIMAFIREIVAPEKLLYEELLKCPKVTVEVPWDWDEGRGCISVPKSLAPHAWPSE